MHCSKNPRLSAATLASYPGMLSPLIAVVEAEAVTAASDLRDWAHGACDFRSPRR
jgi:hypothetical protein